MSNTAAIYARVSTAQQEDGTSLETQVEACCKLAAEHHLELEQHHIFREQASGADRYRPLLDKIGQLAGNGIIQTIIVYSPDRLSRDPLHLMVLSEEFAETGVNLLFV